MTSKMAKTLLRITLLILIGALVGWLIRVLLPFKLGAALLFVGFLWCAWRFWQLHRAVKQLKKEARESYEQSLRDKISDIKDVD